MENNKIFCPNCGNELPAGSSFCTACGTNINQQAPQAPVTNQTPVYNQAPVYNQTPVYNQAPVSEPTPEAGKKKKKGKKKFLIIVAAVLAVCILFSIIGSSGDSRKYDQAKALLEEGKYSEAYAIFYELVDYEDSATYLPFYGKYVSVSIDDKRTITFDGNGQYTKVIPSTSSDDYQYNGTYSVSGYTSATLTANDSGSSTGYSTYENYIYVSDDEDFAFDEKIDISNGCFDKFVKEDMSTSGIKIHMSYDFDADGTYVSITSSSFNSSKPYEIKKTGTYEVDGNTLVLTPNETGKTIKLLVIDGVIYRDVYIREY